MLVEALIDARLLYRHQSEDCHAIARALSRAVAAFIKENSP
jgi:hypothetical protein